MFRFNGIICAAALLPNVLLAVYSTSLPSHPASGVPCPNPNGTFSVNQLGLYPENADFNAESCLLYISALFNATLAIHDPYKDTTEIISFPNITQNPAFHLSGVATSPYTNLTSVVVNAGAAFDTGGEDISGTNLLLLWDPTTKKELYRVNLTETTKGTYGGFQDVEFDKEGNVYVVGTFPSSILRVENNGTKVNEWFNSNGNHTITGFQGLAATGDILLANDNADYPNGSLVKFDMTASKGLPTTVPIIPPRPISGSDAIYLPPKYDNTVLLLAVPATGVEVLRSKDGLWNTAEGLGQVSNNVMAAHRGNVTAVVQIGSRIYMNEEFFGDAQPGNRTQFPYVDITEEVEKLLDECE
ncbi:hypothetical protein DM02DRAFT_728209 [Periconia macrospinosa]|uniref:Uncharacterized protein n=1 Tax=Periconia macrospinosa TaxID=97972 RepID=A0A2V1DSF6_9PLEO|nr:hypothetical protein DM02DRAFT_728209 [Periconia macrospinosa]